MRKKQLSKDGTPTGTQPLVPARDFHRTRIEIRWLEAESQTLAFALLAIKNAVPVRESDAPLFPMHPLGAIELKLHLMPEVEP